MMVEPTVDGAGGGASGDTDGDGNGVYDNFGASADGRHDEDTVENFSLDETWQPGDIIAPHDAVQARQYRAMFACVHLGVFCFSVFEARTQMICRYRFLRPRICAVIN
jgi:hypothetical protein